MSTALVGGGIVVDQRREIEVGPRSEDKASISPIKQPPQYEVQHPLAPK